MNDAATVRATEAYVRIIIRRPHAYTFLNETFSDQGGIASATPAGCVTADGTTLPLPGLYVLDSDGGFLGVAAIRSVEALVELLQEPDGMSTTSQVEPADSERVSIRVSGFTAAEGIT